MFLLSRLFSFILDYLLCLYGFEIISRCFGWGRLLFFLIYKAIDSQITSVLIFVILGDSYFWVMIFLNLPYFEDSRAYQFIVYYSKINAVNFYFFVKWIYWNFNSLIPDRFIMPIVVLFFLYFNFLYSITTYGLFLPKILVFLKSFTCRIVIFNSTMGSSYLMLLPKVVFVIESPLTCWYWLLEDQYNWGKDCCCCIDVLMYS